MMLLADNYITISRLSDMGNKAFMKERFDLDIRHLGLIQSDLDAFTIELIMYATFKFL